MNKQFFLYSFIVVSIVYFFSSLLQIDSLELGSKILYLPLLFGYYLTVVQTNFQYRIVISFVFFYIAELIAMQKPNQFSVLYVLFFLLPYLMFLFYMVGDLYVLIKDRGIKNINISVLIVFMLMIYLFLSVISIIEINSVIESLLLYVYGSVLVMLSVVSMLIYILKNSVQNLFLILTIITFVVSDMFYIFIIKFEYNWVFKSVNLLTQLMSYYFFIHYALLKMKSRSFFPFQK